MVVTVIAVVKQRDIPVGRQAVEEFEQGAGAFGEGEAQQQFILDSGHAPADHVADMELGHFVVGHVFDVIALTAQDIDSLPLLPLAVAETEAEENMGRSAARQTIIELGDRARAQGLDEGAITAGLLGDGDRQQRLAAFTNLGALGNVAQPVEIEIGAAVDGDPATAGRGRGESEGLQAGKRQRAGGLGDGARVIEDVLDRGADRVGVHRHHLIEKFTTEAKGQLADLAHGDTIGKQADLTERHALIGLQGGCHARGILRFDADHLDVGPQEFDRGRDAGGEAATSDRDEHGFDRIGMLPQDFEADGALSGNDVEIVERMNESQALLPFDLPGLGIGLIECIAMQDHLSAAALHRVDLDRRGGARHHDGRLGPQALRGEGEPLRMIAGGGADHAPCQCVGWERGKLVVGATQLEGEDRLQVFAFEKHRRAEALGQPRHRIERAFDRDIIDAGGQYLLDQVLHKPSPC